MAEETTDNPVAAAAPTTGSKNPILTVLVLLNTVLMGVVAYFQYTSHLKQSAQPNVQDVIKAQMESLKDNVDSEEGLTPTGAAKKDEGKLFELKTFTANLAQGEGPRRYVRLNAVLKFSKASSEEEFTLRRSQIRDVIISTLNAKRAEDLLKTSGKSYLKEEIKAAINTFLVDGEVIDVFYVGFQVH